MAMPSSKPEGVVDFLDVWLREDAKTALASGLLDSHGSRGLAVWGLHCHSGFRVRFRGLVACGFRVQGQKTRFPNSNIVGNAPNQHLKATFLKKN